ncbi:MAG: peptidoglycan DD-metalloendopeptidase family protein [Longimicrobiales bacterium]
MHRRIRMLMAALVLPVTAVLPACRAVEDVRDYFLDAVTPHERYAASLLAAGLEGTALAGDWLLAAKRSLEQPVAISAPYAEDGFLPTNEPTAIAYRLSARRGQRFLINAHLPADSNALLFLDVFQVPADTLDPLRDVASADSGSASLEFEPRRDTDYIIRFQPEVLRGGRYTIEIRAEPMLAFPVHGHNAPDIGSVFGDPRDGGVRDHHGVDIFAPRGTPALAAIEATVSRVETTPRGGNVVWLRATGRGVSLYYAHLDSQTVSQGMRVEIGDTVGLVGNTGNARTTPPHLHFGVYQRGPVDPYPFVYYPRGTMPRLAVDTTLIGGWTRVTRNGVTLRPTVSVDATPIAEIPQHTAMRVLAGSGSLLRVRLPDGRSGFVSADFAELATQPIGETRLAPGDRLHVSPDPNSVVLDLVDADEAVDILGRFGDFLFVRPSRGPAGWVNGQY